MEGQNIQEVFYGGKDIVGFFVGNTSERDRGMKKIRRILEGYVITEISPHLIGLVMQYREKREISGVSVFDSPYLVAAFMAFNGILRDTFGGSPDRECLENLLNLISSFIDEDHELARVYKKVGVVEAMKKAIDAIKQFETNTKRYFQKYEMTQMNPPYIDACGFIEEIVSYALRNHYRLFRGEGVLKPPTLVSVDVREIEEGRKYVIRFSLNMPPIEGFSNLSAAYELFAIAEKK